MTEFLLRDARESDFDTIVSLNAAAVQHTSAMDTGRLRELAALATHHRVVDLDGRVVAFLLAMNHDVKYQNENFAWFSTRYAQFVYVDRIVIDATCAGAGLGTRLYSWLFVCARAAGFSVITCEYNIEPPNPASQRFHDRFNFREVGRRWAVPGIKLVSLQAAAV